MATAESDQTAVPPEDCELGSLVWDMDKDLPGEVVGHLGGDRVQLRALRGGKEWDAFKLRPPTVREEARVRGLASNDVVGWRP